MKPCSSPEARDRHLWHQRARLALRQSLRLRLIVVFVLLAMATSAIFIGGVRNAFAVGWRDLTRPLLADYVDRLVLEIGTPPSIDKARALAQRLPVSVRISGPLVNWQSGMGDFDAGRSAAAGGWPATRPLGEENHWHGGHGPALLTRTTADGHRIELGLNFSPIGDRPRNTFLWTLALLLLLTALSYAYIRRLLRPLDDIRAGARRFGEGDFSEPIRVRRVDELGTLAADVNAMGQSIRQMLDAKRALLLAISHELRSPLTRARLNTELLPEDATQGSQRQALLKDLGLMRDLIADLLESERLASSHAALQLQIQPIEPLAREVLANLGASHRVSLDVASGLPDLPLDGPRVRLLIRNLVDNALRYTPAGQPAPLVQLRGSAAGGITLSVRDFGAGVDEADLPRLAEAFYRPDASRGRASGGVGLGLYLCKLVAEAHGASWAVDNARPGLVVTVVFPLP